MRGLWLALLFSLFCLSARAQNEDPLWLQVDAVTVSAVKKQTGLSVHWTGDSGPDLLWTLTIFADEERVLRLLAADGIQRNRMGWRPDLDRTPGQLEIRLDELWLAPGQYTVQVDLPDGRGQDFALWIEESPLGSDRQITVDLPTNVTRLTGWRSDPTHGHHAFTWWPILAPGRALLELSDAEWTLLTDGMGDSQGTRVSPNDTHVQIKDVPRELQSRSLEKNRDGWVWLGLLPLGLILTILGTLGVWKSRNAEGLQGALFLSIGAGLVVIQPVLTDPGAYLLGAVDGSASAVESVAQLATMSNALFNLSAHGNAYAWPDGIAWLTGEPGWLGYLFPTLLSATTDPITAHNLGLGLGISLLSLCTWALLKTLHTSQAAALMGATAAALSPVILDDIDSQGMDQSTLFLIPLFMLLLHKAMRHEGWWHPILAGATLAATYHAHQYFGSFLWLCAPLMVSWRLPGKGIKKRLTRTAVVLGTAILLLIPAWVLAQLETDETNAQAEEIRLVDTDVDLWRPFEDQTSSIRLLKSSQAETSSSEIQSSDPMKRLASTVNHSSAWSELFKPTNLLAAGGLFWPLALLSVALARHRIIAVIALADVCLLLFFALGPFIYLDAGRIGPALPYYAIYLWLPGFDTLDQIDHFLRMAGVLAPVPIALGLDGGMEQGARLWSRLLHFSRLRVLGARSRLSPIVLINRLVEPFIWQFKYALYAPLLVFGLAVSAGFSLATQRTDIESENLTQSSESAEPWVPPWPEIHRVPRHPGLKGVPQGTAVALPLMNETSPGLYLPLSRAGIKLVNPSPVGVMSPPRRNWIDENPLLNHIAWVSGSDGPSMFLSYDPAQAAQYAQNLIDTGLDFFIMFRPHMPSRELAAETEHALDELFPRVKDDGRVAIWAIRPVEDLR